MGNPSLTLRRLGLLLGPARVPRLAPARSLQDHFTVHNASAVPARSGSSSSGDVGVIQFSFRASSFRLLLLSDWPSGRNISAGTWTMYCLAGAGWIPRNITLREYKGETLSAYEQLRHTVCRHCNLEGLFGLWLPGLHREILVCIQLLRAWLDEGAGYLPGLCDRRCFSSGRML